MSADLASQPAAASGRQADQPRAAERLAEQSVISERPARRFARRNSESAPEPVRTPAATVLERPRPGLDPTASGHDQVKGTEERASSSSERGPSCAAAIAPEPELGVLAQRLAGSLVHHEPGWRMPRFSVLARHFGVTTEQVAAAVNQLAGRRLVRCQGDGHFSRFSPAVYHIPLPAQACLRTAVVPLGGALTCRAKAITMDGLRDDIAWALGGRAGEAGCVLRLQFAADDELAALSATYVRAAFRPVLDKLAGVDPPELLPFGGHDPARDCRGTRSVQLEMQPPPAGVAGLIHLAPGEKAIMITARVDERAAGGPAVLTVAILRPDRFRVTIGSTDTPLVAPLNGPVGGEWSAAPILAF